MKQISIDTVKQKDQNAGGYFFSDNTMAFFSSQPDPIAYETDNGEYIVFVDSVKDKYSGNPREYKVRLMDCSTGKPYVMSAVVHCSSLKTARSFARRMIEGHDVLCSDGAAVILPDMNKGMWFAWFGAGSSHAHVYQMGDGAEVHAYSIASETDTLTPEEVRENMRVHMWSGYDLDL